LKSLEDRGTLCESQRRLADVLVVQGRLDEAETVALEAIETVGPHDISSQATTRVSLALVRVAQGLEDEAETLMREAWERVEGTGYRSLEAWVVEQLAQFLRDRGRRDSAVDLRAAELPRPAPADADLASSTVPIA
jgi:ATP/maltotriose-dependent transcriptional regulator MalT